ncbi:CLUMA_CG003731, isoform A [Clunio marinus]|uniref:26S proteasome non-ATPase regulatory subunit 5 n=1 Tax=Clunio marinus TaxID=568069 RepID=A0A1J1HPN9_9DIPT|nr:CLUMA_CG003731, isoform A [Clunio marinus]
MESIDLLLKALETTGNDETIQEKLNEIKKHLIHCAESSKNVLNSKEFLRNANSEVAYDILEMCMTNLKINDEPDLFDITEMILKHPNAKVKTVAVRFVEKNLQHSTALHKLQTIMMFIECLKSNETSIGIPSIQILIELLKLQNFIDDPAVKKQLLSTIENEDDVIALRVYSVAVGVAKGGSKELEKMEYLLEKCINEMNKEDVLVLMNVLEILKELCLTSFGLVYLENKGVFDNLVKRIDRINEDPLVSILVPGLMKFFGNVAAVFPEKIFNAYPALINTLYNCLLGDDFQLLYTALDTLGHLTRHEYGKITLDSLNTEQCVKVLVHVSKTIPNYPTDLKVRAINCFENVFWIDPMSSRNNQVNYICQKWFSSIFGSDLMVVINFCKNAFEDISTSAFKLLRSLIYHDFGQRAVAATGGFVEYLLDRNSNITLEVKQIKYEIIEVLAESNAFEAAVTLQLQKYVREGFNYVQGVTEIAFEST